MRKHVLILTVAVLALSASEVRAATVLPTTKADVKRECGGKLGCIHSCGSTKCIYGCKGSNCTVSIELKVGAGGPMGGVKSGGTKAR